MKRWLSIGLYMCAINVWAQVEAPPQSKQPTRAEASRTTIRLDSLGLIAAQQDTTQLDSLKQIAAQRDTTQLDSLKQIAAQRWDSLRQDSLRQVAEQLEKIRADSIARALDRRDSLREQTSYVPTGIRFGTDLIALVRRAIPDGWKGWEVSGDVDINRFFLTGEWGQWEREISTSTQQYANEGAYFRIGVDVAFFSKRRSRHIFFLGGRYGFSEFSESLAYEFENDQLGALQKTVTSSNARAEWGEITAGFRMKLWKGLWMGYTLRLKLEPKIHNSSTDTLSAYDIPGFGKVEQKPNWGFNYQLFWRFGLPRR